ncbi:phosphatase PAP2 family protein [Oceaniglobus roseus]|uniref:phosphatase PAP2 family protein n=1 Tax=Oceaniglobus roseus TaxID=1737570 RepID=UPI000C7EC13A|nr:phosphatase PAP2 family protein [Kandeliimicrobium roseum]
MTNGTVIGRMLAAVLVTAALACILFLRFPQLDLAVSRHYFDAARGGFLYSHAPVWEAVRAVLRASSYALGVGAILLCALGPRVPLWMRLPRRVTGFVAASYVAGPVVFVNLWMKRSSGRARPRNVTEFGGPDHYTPPFTFADQCHVNCSFVSAETAGMATLCLTLGLLIAPRLTGVRRWLFVAGLAALVVFTGWLRIAFGGHFLSDTVFAALAMGLIVPVVYLAFGLAEQPVGRERARAYGAQTASRALP